MPVSVEGEKRITAVAQAVERSIAKSTGPAYARDEESLTELKVVRKLCNDYTVQLDFLIGMVSRHVQVEQLIDEIVDEVLAEDGAESEMEKYDPEHGSKLTPEELAEAERQVEIERSEGWLNARIR